MLLYPSSITSKLGFDKIRDLIADGCNSDLGRDIAVNMEILDDYQEIQGLLNETEELTFLLQTGDAFPELRVVELAPELSKSSVAGYFIPAELLFGLVLNLELAKSCLKYFRKNGEDYPLWNEESTRLELPDSLLARLHQTFDKHGEIKDGASPKLKKLRTEIRNKETKARRGLESILKQSIAKGYTEASSALTIRDGRLVVPLHAEHKRHIKGLVVDESTTGKTVFMEPLEVFDQNNEIRELHFAERREIIAILTDLTSEVAQNQGPLLRLEQFLAKLDFTASKAKLAMRLNACKPNFEDSNNFKLSNARHPILMINHQSQGAPVVPLDLEIHQSQRVVVISGPNAGGKSVCLKTVGLLQMMLQAGMLVPLDEQSTMGCFKELFVDIGDEQSIESDLSTYSSHLKNMKYFLDRCSEHTLFLIDEFGTGTEPQFGGAIAQAILMNLVNADSRGLVTTHYGNLKKYAEEALNVVNAAMRFDLNNLTPLYQLELGRPGSSFALEIAAQIGLSSEILKEAKSMIGHDPVAYESLVNELEQEKQKYHAYNQQNEQLKDNLKSQQSDYLSKSQELERNRKEIVNNAKVEAQRILAETNQRIEATIRSIQENKARKAVTRKVRKDLDDFRNKNKPEKPKVQRQKEVVPGPINPGDIVEVKDNNARGEVLSISGNSAQILIGSLKSNIRLDRLQKLGKAKSTKSNKSKPVSTNLQLHKKRAHFSSQLDVRGMRAGAAVSAVSDFIDEGLLLNMGTLSILHGKGDGILREVIRKHLQNEPSVASIQDEHVDRGGSGITLVTLK